MRYFSDKFSFWRTLLEANISRKTVGACFSGQDFGRPHSKFRLGVAFGSNIRLPRLPRVKQFLLHRKSTAAGIQMCIVEELFC